MGQPDKMPPALAKLPARPAPPVDFADRRALAAYRPADPEVVREATRLKEAALLDFGIKDSVIASWLYAKCHHQIPTTAIDTAAVTAAGDGVCRLLYNPDFFVRLGLAGVKFVLFHEARHLMQRHLYVAPELRDDPAFTIATEVTVNHVALRRLNQPRLPTVAAPDDPTGATREPTGIDPTEIHRRYSQDLRAHGQTPLPYAKFVETDMSVYRELKRMTVPIVPPLLCIHLRLDSDGGEGVPAGALPMDPETVELIATRVLEQTAQQARRGNGAAKDELLELAARAGERDERLERMWGLLGLAALRGETVRTRRVEWWKRWLVDVLASKLREGERLVYPRKLGAVMLSLGHDPMLLRRGRERVKVVLIALDTSASMPNDAVTWLASLVGETDGMEAHWVSFDGEVIPFKPGEWVLGGGGTSFQNVVDYAEGRLEVGGHRFEERVDAVIMVTDGHARQVAPAEPDKWIWLITRGGDTWPERRDPPMACHQVDVGDR